MTDRKGGRALDVMHDASQIAARVQALASDIAKLGLERPLVVPILRGSFVFAADLIRALHFAGVEPETDFLMLSGHRGSSRSPGSVEILRDLESHVEQRDVLLIDDILATGRTLAFAKDLIAARGARRIVTCVLLEKTVHREVQIDVEFRGFRCDDVFVVGYGMDLAHSYRELPYIARLA